MEQAPTRLLSPWNFPGKWSGLPFPSPGDLSDPGIEPRSPALQAEALTSDTREAIKLWVNGYMYTQTHTHTHGGSLVAQLVKNPPANAGDSRDSGSVSGLGRSPGEGNGNQLQYSCLENPMDRGAWQATVHGVARVGHDLATKPPPPYLRI